MPAPYAPYAGEAERAFSVPLMDICTLNTPLVKRVPNSQASSFATAWGRLLNQAVLDKTQTSWSEFFMFPKCMLWTPSRGGKRLAKKTNFAELVRVRLKRWPKERKELWNEVIERSKRPLVEEA